jgi:predicted  nucleic acid-binding Zn-ribbon protein
MSEGDRSIALTTACDDLQAQLEAGDRSFRRLDNDVSCLGEALRSAANHTETIASLLRHLNELRGNMREQRSALREVRKAAAKLCTTVAEARDTMTTLADGKQALDDAHAARVREMPQDLAAHETHGHHLHDHVSELREFTKRLPATKTSLRNPKG